MQYIVNRENKMPTEFPRMTSILPSSQIEAVSSLTEIWEGDLYFCLEQRKVSVQNQVINLTVREFDALHLLIINKKRVMTFETISYHVWGEDYIDVTTQAIHNLMSRLRQKLQTVPGMPDYIISIRGVGYKYESFVEHVRCKRA